MILRPAKASDVDDMLAVKRSLVFQEDDSVSEQGGFLLGSTAEGYRNRIAQELTWVIDDNGVKGFSIALPDHALRASEIWLRRDQIQWNIDPDPIEKAKLGYYDQLAVLPGPWRALAPALAIVCILDFLRQDPDYLFSSTVIKPVVNKAAVPYLTFLGGKRVGQLDERDPVVGQLVSDIWLAPKAGIEAFVNTPPSLTIAAYVDRARHSLMRHKP